MKSYCDDEQVCLGFMSLNETAAELEQPFTASMASLLVDLSPGLGHDDRHNLLRGIDLARAHVMFYCRAKVPYK